MKAGEEGVRLYDELEPLVLGRVILGKVDHLSACRRRRRGGRGGGGWVDGWVDGEGVALRREGRTQRHGCREGGLEVGLHRESEIGRAHV